MCLSGEWDFSSSVRAVHFSWATHKVISSSSGPNITGVFVSTFHTIDIIFSV